MMDLRVMVCIVILTLLSCQTGNKKKNFIIIKEVDNVEDTIAIINGEVENTENICVIKSNIPNSHGLISQDICYLEALTSQMSITLNKSDSFSTLDIGIGRLQGSNVSPFLYGTKLIGLGLNFNEDNTLNYFTEVVLNEPSDDTIYYKRQYNYDNQLIKEIQTINVGTGEIEQRISFRYIW